MLDILQNVTSVTSILAAVLVSIASMFIVRQLWTALKSPGPWGVPILGFYPFLRNDVHVQLYELSKRYGEVYVINIAGQNFVYLGSMRALKEAHVNKIEDFPSRGHKHGVMQYPLKEGLLYLEGEQWKVQRKFFMQSMREIGLSINKEELKSPLSEAILSTIETFHKSGGEPMDVHKIMAKQCTNVIRRLVLGDNVSEEFDRKLEEAYSKVISPLLGPTALYIGNIAKYAILPGIPSYGDMLSGSDDLDAMLVDIIEEHKSSFDPSQPRDFIDLYLRERALKDEKTLQEQSFTDIVLVKTLAQVYGDGSVTVGLFLAHFLQFVSRHQEVQEAIYKDIVREVGTERFPSWNDRQSLHLTNSAIKEMTRVSNFLNIFPDLECIRNTTILGVHVPKGTMTLLNIWAIHNDPMAFENPEVVDITRFLPNKPKVDNPVLFGIGKRACAGESLVMAEVFLTLTAILQNFQILPGINNDAKELSVDSLANITVRAIPRSTGVRFTEPEEHANVT